MMRQNIVFVENKPGSLKQVTQLLKAENINIYGFACFDAPEFAVFRMICSNPEKALKILDKAGYMNRLTNAIVADLKDEIGGLDEFLDFLAESNVSLDYIYMTFHRETRTPVVILHSEEISVTESILKNDGFHVMDNPEELEK